MFEYYDAKSQEWIVETILDENIDEILSNLFENLEKEEKSYGHTNC